ncbi:xanthine dehydrogenase small subunit [Kushneria aurantia]|uniref:Xanthine dehydrogenase small subunit n=1 Tax=Kushneria aurantia TaxID=504092 RepID=A0ABV6G4A6_9GAMM|nr:xanthine dehydrogenase small subunit [Kushneria aurantia]
MLSFTLNGRSHCCPDPAPGVTVLALLRETLRACGSKEGCASGDCGACTVAIGVQHEDGVHYESANACITPAQQLTGCHLVTVEGLARGARLHPVQQAMVDHHASQCGFCTPGIVMSLFCLYHDARIRKIDDHAIDTALEGNLCRCTGYRPIRDAARAMRAVEWPLEPPETPPAAPHDSGGGWHCPADLAALRGALAEHPEARLIAGGTDLMLESTLGLVDFETVIDLSRIAELGRIEAQPDGWWIGAGVRYARLEPLLDEHYPDFAALLARLGSRQIRNRATLAGNLANASPIGDTPPVLLALDARVLIDGADGEREMALTDFFIDYRRTALAAGEFLRAVWLPRPAPGQHLRVHKLSRRPADDITAVLLALRYRLDDAGHLHEVRLACGGMSPKPQRAPTCEALLEGQRLAAETLEAACAALAEDYSPIDDVRGSRDYRLNAAANLLRRHALQLYQPQATIRLEEIDACAS